MQTKTKILVQKRKIRFTCDGFPYLIINNEKWKIKKLLTNGDTNAKTKKNKLDTKGFSAAPHELSGHQVCGKHTAGCAVGCLGEQGMASVHKSILCYRIVRSAFMAQHPKLFRSWLMSELIAFDNQQARLGTIGAVRLNMFSDRPFERWINLERFSNLAFYDYTKFENRVGQLAANYWVTFSRSENNQAQAISILRNKIGNVAVVFADKKRPFVGNRSKLQRLPKTWHRFPVVDGDISDYRPDDPRGGHVIGLRCKANSNASRLGMIQSGFAVEVN